MVNFIFKKESVRLKFLQSFSVQDVGKWSDIAFLYNMQGEKVQNKSPITEPKKLSLNSTVSPSISFKHLLTNIGLFAIYMHHNKLVMDCVTSSEKVKSPWQNNLNNLAIFQTEY